MKAVDQLIQYFWERGKITEAEMVRLKNNGFGVPLSFIGMKSEFSIEPRYGNPSRHGESKFLGQFNKYDLWHNIYFRPYVYALWGSGPYDAKCCCTADRDTINGLDCYREAVRRSKEIGLWVIENNS